MIAIRAAARRVAVSIVFVLACGLLTGCPGKGGGAETSSNTFRYALESEPTTLDPAMVEDGMTIDLQQNVFEGLVAWNEKSEIVPAVAEKWDISADGKTYTFHIRSGVKFHNGREVTADDVKYSFERSCDPDTKSPTASTYMKDIVGALDKLQHKANEVSGVKVVDPHTVQVTIDEFKPYWLGNMTYPTGYVVCKEAIEKNGGKLDENAMIGTGPFKLKSFQRGYQVELAANDDYWRGRPKVDYIVRPILKDANSRLNNYESGKLDLLVVSPRDLDQITGDPTLNAQLHTFNRPAIWYVAMNLVAPGVGPALAKRDVRRAITMAIDKNEVIRLALKGKGAVATGIVPPGIPGYTTTAKPLPFDPDQARKLLASAGYPNGAGLPTLVMSYRNDEPWVDDGAQVIRSQLRKSLNIDVQLRPMAWAEFLTARQNKTLALAHERWMADYLDPQDFLTVMFHTSKKIGNTETYPENGLGYSNPTFDSLCERADTEHDPAKRTQLYQQAEQIVLDDAPWAPIYFQEDLELIKPDVKGIRDSLFGHLPYYTVSVTSH